MTDAVSIPGPATADGGPPGLAGAWLTEDDLLALLDGLDVAGTHDPEEDQEAIATSEWAARRADGADRASNENRTDSQVTRDNQDCADGHGRAVSPVLVAEHLPAGPGLAGLLASSGPDEASDWDLPGLASGFRRLAAWAQARELAAVAEIVARRAAANPRIGADEAGRPAVLPPEAAAEVALELVMSQPGASAWTELGCQLRWALPGTAAALAAGTIELCRARIIAEATLVLRDEHAAAVEARVLPAAAGQTNRK